MAEPVDEWVEDAPADEWVEDAPTPQIAQPGNPVDYGNYVEPGQLPQRQPTAWEQYAANEPKPPVGFSPSQSGNEGLSVGQRISKNLSEAEGGFASGVPLLGDAVTGAKVLYGMAQPPLDELKKTYINPTLTQAQGAIRESGFASPVTDPALLLGGEPAETLAQNLLSLAIGPPEQYQTTAEQERRAVGVADSKLAQGLGRVALGPLAGPAVSPETASGFAYGATKELAYLPLYLIDARQSAGAVERAAIGGGLSEALDPRPEADIARGTAFAGALGAGLNAGVELVGAAKKAHAAVTWLRTLDGEVAKSAQRAINVTPAEDIAKLIEAPAAGPLKAGAQRSFNEAKVESDVVYTRPVAVTPDGQKLAGDWLPVGQKGAPVRGITLATPEAREAMKGLEGEFGDVIVSRDMSADDLTLTPQPGYGLDEVSIRENGRERVAFQDDAALPLHELPEGDTLVSWKREGSALEFKAVRARTLQRESLIRRSPVEVTIGGEKYVGFAGAEDSRTGNVIIVAPEAAEKIPGALTDDVSVPADRISHVSPKRISELLDVREAALVVEREAAQEAARVAKESQAAADMARIIVPGAAQAPAPLRLPKELRGAKPNYNYGSKAFSLEFESDVDKALYIAAQNNPSRRDADYVNFAMDALGASEEEVRQGGRMLRDVIKSMAKTNEPGVLRIPAFADAAGHGAEKQVVQAAIAQPGSPIVQTPTGPKIAVTATQGQPPPQPPPPQLPTPNTPTPPTPIMANGNGGIIPPGININAAAGAPPPPTGNFIQRGLNALQQAGWAVMDKFINTAARGKRGPLTDDPLNMLRAAEAAGAFQAQSSLDSLLPRMLDAGKKRVAPWVDALPAASKAQFQRDVLDVLSSRGATIADLKLKWPQLAAGIENATTDFKYRIQLGNDRIKAGGWVPDRDFTAPEGMRQVVDDILDDEMYVARLYLAPLAGPGEMKRLLKEDRVLHADIIHDIAKDIVKRSKPSGTNPASVYDEARIELETWLGNPDGIIADPLTGGTGSTNRQGAAAMKERRAAKLEAMGLTYQQWRQNNVSAVKPSMRFVKGDLNEAQLLAELNKAGITLPANDIKFLREMRDEVGEQLKPWQKKALRQVQDPFTRAAFSVARQDAIIVQMEAVAAARDAGMLKTQLELQAFGIDPVLDGWKQVPADRATFGPWAERSGPEQGWVHPEAWEHLNNIPKLTRSLNMLVADMMSSESLLARSGIKAHFWTKTMLTVGSPSAWGSNIFGNMWGVVKAGVNPLDVFSNGSWSRAVSQWREFAFRPNQVTIRGQKITGADWMREGMKYGTVGADAFTEELGPGMKQLLREDVLGNITQPHHLATAWRKTQGAVQSVKEWYTAIDSVFRHGTWLTLLKKGGVDLDTGKLLDRKAADLLINGSRFRQATVGSTTAIDLSTMSDDEVVDVLKSAMSWRLRRSFAVPGQPGQGTRNIASVNNATLGLSGNMFARTAIEEIRSDAMLPYRAATEPGVAGALMGWGAVLGGVTLAAEHATRSTGVTDEDAKMSIQGLPTSARSYSPALQAVSRYDENGRMVVFDLGRAWQPLRYTAGDVMGRSIPDQIGIAPGQLGARAFYNVTAGAVFGGSPLGDGIIAPAARGLGLDLPQQYNAPVLDEGPQSLAKRASAYVLPGIVTQLMRAQSRAADPSKAGVGEYLKPATGGLLQVGGTPEQAGKNSKNEAKYIEAERDRQQALRSAARKTDDEDEAARLREERNRLKQQRGTTKRYQSENP